MLKKAKLFMLLTLAVLFCVCIPIIADSGGSGGGGMVVFTPNARALYDRHGNWTGNCDTVVDDCMTIAFDNP